MSGIYRGPNSSVAAQFVNADGDKGDIVVSNSGELWTIDALAVNSSKVSSIDATKLNVSPLGNLTSTNVQSALEELQLDVDTRLTSTELTDHLNDTTDAHDATAISSVPNGNLVATNVGDALNELQSDIDLRVAKTSDTGSAVLPVGTTAQRDGSPVTGYTRFNSTTGKAEIYDGTEWGSIGGGATGGTGNATFYLNDQTITQDFTIPTGQNAGTFGPISIATGVTVTVPTGSTWSIT